MTDDLTPYLLPSTCVDSDHPDVLDLALTLCRAGAPDIDNAVTLYYWVRDEIRYNPYALGTTLEDHKASRTLAAGQGWCVPKAALLAALCRSVGIPARLGFADVRNHLSTQRLRDSMGTDLFYFHGYTSLYLEGGWVKATPAFNLALCEKFHLKPLEFDGREDSLYHPFDELGNRHMEYVNDRGEHLDIPFEEMMAVFRAHYPGMFTDVAGSGDSWDRDVELETTGATRQR